MMSKNKYYCFCALALSKRYIEMAIQVAGSIEEFLPGTKLVVLTDRPKQFAGVKNVMAYNTGEKEFSGRLKPR